MADTIEQSSNTYSGGHKGFLIGAAVGAVIAGLVGLVFALLNFGEGGPGLHIMAGAAFGGFVGLFIGAFRAQRKLRR